MEKIKKYVKDVFRTTSILFISVLFTVWLVTFALTYPPAPSWQIVWWNFMNYFNKILVNTSSTTDWKVKNADKLDGYNHTDFIKTETDPTVSIASIFSQCRTEVNNWLAPSYVSNAQCNSDEKVISWWWCCWFFATCWWNWVDKWLAHFNWIQSNGWVVDCYQSDGSGEAVSIARAICCK